MKKNLLFLCLCLFTAPLLFAQTVPILNPIYGTSGNVATAMSNYAASESIYYESEIGAGNFTTVGTSIKNVAYNVTAVGTNTTFGSVSIYMKNIPLATTTLASGTYSTTGYTLVYSGNLVITATGWQGVTLTTPFVRTTGTNLEVLIERFDNVTHPGFIFNCVNPATGPLNSRRFFAATQTTTLDPTPFRPAIQFGSPLAIDASLTALISGTTSCLTTNNFSVVLRNNGTSPIAVGAAAVTFSMGSPNPYTLTKTNAGNLAAGASETITFDNVNVSTAGTRRDSAYVVLSGQTDRTNDTLKSSFTTATTINVGNGSPAVEGAETTLPVFNYVALVAGTTQLWRTSTAPPKYKNVDLTDSLGARSGSTFYLFDSYSGASSVGFVSRLFSNCISLPATVANCTSNVSFWLSHDNSFATDLDSMYLSISTNKGVTWTRLAGYRRYGATYAIPTWVQETVSLTAYQGQTFQLGFEGVSKYGNIIGLDDITVSSTCALPVSLASFKGERRGSLNNLEWTTSTEANNSGFELQRSADGTNFSKLAFIPSKAATGNSNAAITYSFNDMKPFISNGYYRLKQLDKDGKATLSNIVLIKGNKVSVLTVSSIYPNPVEDNIKLIITAAAQQTVTISIVDFTGKTITTKLQQAVAGDNTVQINTANLATGSYLLKATNSLGETSIQKFIKQ